MLTTPSYLLILDNDMEPHPKFLLSTLPLFFEHKFDIDGFVNPMTEAFHEAVGRSAPHAVVQAHHADAA